SHWRGLYFKIRAVLRTGWKLSQLLPKQNQTAICILPDYSEGNEYVRTIIVDAAKNVASTYSYRQAILVSISSNHNPSTASPLLLPCFRFCGRGDERCQVLNGRISHVDVFKWRIAQRRKKAKVRPGKPTAQLFLLQPQLRITVVTIAEFCKRVISTTFTNAQFLTILFSRKQSS